MSMSELLSDLTRRGIRLEPRLHVEAPIGALTRDEREKLRVHKPDLLRILLASAPTAKLSEPEGTEIPLTTPNSRSPLVPAEVRDKIENIEADARAKGWPAELLWSGGFWACPRGLAAVLDEKDEIAKVTSDYIEILKVSRHLLRFRRHIA